VEFLDLGRHSWGDAGGRTAAGKDSLYRHLRRGLRVAITFLIVSLAWVFFRAETLPGAIEYSSRSRDSAAIRRPGSLVGLMYSRYTC